MVRLTRIYTRAGDKGMTALGDGKRVPKTHRRIAAYGTVDELNSVLGLALVQRGLKPADRAFLRGVQNDLFDVGADLCVPRRRGERAAAHLRIVPEQVQGLERAIDARNRRLAPLRSFVLPGGTAAAAALHVARTVCRRAEIAVAHLLEAERDAVGPQVLPYLNRLSDLLFVLARCANGMGRADVLWQPGAGRPPQRGPRAARRRDAGQAAIRTRARIRGKARRGASSSPSLASAHSA